MTLGLFLLIFGFALPFLATCLILLGYLLGRIRPIDRWRSRNVLHPEHNVAMRSLGLPTTPQALIKYQGEPLPEFEETGKLRRIR